MGKATDYAAVMRESWMILVDIVGTVWVVVTVVVWTVARKYAIGIGWLEAGVCAAVVVVPVTVKVVKVMHLIARASDPKNEWIGGVPGREPIPLHISRVKQ